MSEPAAIHDGLAKIDGPIGDLLRVLEKIERRGVTWGCFLCVES